METWQTILLALTGNTLALAVIAWLIKSLIGNTLQKDLEKHKSDLALANQSAAEQLRYQLSVAAHERGIIFSKLHEKRGEVIALIYSQLSDVTKKGRSYTSPVEMGGEPTKHEKFATFADSYNQLTEYFERNKIYLPAKTCKELDSLLDAIRSHVVELRVGFLRSEDKGDPDGQKTMLQAWDKSWTFFIDQVPAVRQSLESDLRQLIGSS
jgi:hypothetical protein